MTAGQKSAAVKRKRAKTNVGPKPTSIRYPISASGRKQKVKTKKSSYYKTIFRGILITLSMNKKFNGKVQTNISKIKNYCKAEAYHQKYIEKNKQ